MPACLVRKDLLPMTVLGHYQCAVPWLPTTIDMRTHTAAFVAEYRRRNDANAHNVWVLKPAQVWCRLV